MKNIAVFLGVAALVLSTSAYSADGTVGTKDVKPVGSVINRLCGTVRQGTTTQIVAVKSVCYASVVGVKGPIGPAGFHTFLVVALNDGSAPTIYQAQYDKPGKADAKGQISTKITLLEHGTVIGGRVVSRPEGRVRKGSAVEVKDSKGIVEITDGRLPGKLKFQARDFKTVMTTQGSN